MTYKKKKVMYISLKAQLQVVDEIIETLQNRKELLKLKVDEFANEINQRGSTDGGGGVRRQ